MWKEFGVTNSFTLETSQFAYNLGEEVVRFAEKDYFRVAVGFLQALHEYGRLVEQLQTETESCEGNSLCATASLGPTSTGMKEVLRHKQKVEIRLQMTPFRPSLGETVDLDWEENTSGEAQFGPVPTTQPGDDTFDFAPRLREDYAHPSDKQIASWKDYFTQAELDEIADGSRQDEEEDKGESRHPKQVNPEDAEKEEEKFPLPHPPAEKANTGEVSPAHIPRRSFEHKDLIHIGYMRRGRDTWDSPTVYNTSTRCERVVHMASGSVRMVLRSGLRYPVPNRCLSREKTTMGRPGTSVGAEERGRRTHATSVQKGTMPTGWEGMTADLAKGPIVKLPTAQDRVRQRLAKQSPDARDFRICAVDSNRNANNRLLSAKKNIQTYRSMIRHRPPMADPIKAREADLCRMAHGREQAPTKSLFTNSTIREHM